MGFRIGKLFGMDVRVDASWLVVAAFLARSLTAFYASLHPEWSFAICLAIALMSAGQLFVAVVIHELAHSFIARMCGMPVHDCTLNLFGGVSTIERRPGTPEGELVVSLAGPFASIGVGIAMLLVTALTLTIPLRELNAPITLLSSLGPISSVLLLLGPINIGVGAFNLLPGFPLDGGRIVRSLIWRLTGSLEHATRISVAIGQGAGVLLIVLSAALMLTGSLSLSVGVWLALVGLFLRSAALTHLPERIPAS